MFRNILLPFDGLKTTMASAKYAIRLAKLLDAKLHILHIINTKALNSAKACLKKPEKEVKRYCLNRVKGLFDGIHKEARRAGLRNYEIKVVFADRIAKGILAFAKKQGIDLCVVQPSPYYHSEITGDLSRTISRNLKTPTLFVKTKGVLQKNGVILVPVDELKQNLISAKNAVKLAKQTGGKIIYYHTTWREPGLKTEEPIKHCDPRALECIELAKKLAEKNNVDYELVVEMAKTIEGGIIKCAVRNSADLIIMTSSPAIIGGQAELVLYNSMYPLMLIRK